VTQFIAHRGNCYGANPDLENHVDYLTAAYRAVGAVEVDVQTVAGQLYLGHNEPQEPADIDMLMQVNWFCHAKDIETLGTLLTAGVHTFWHQEDTVTLTSKGFIWCYPGINLEHNRSIWLDFEGAIQDMDSVNAWGLCADEIPGDVSAVANLGYD